MNVTFDKTVTAANRVWYDPRTDLIHAEIAGVDHAVPLSRLTEEDVESQASISGFAIGQEGAVIVLRHVDGAETWFPSDMWVPGQFELRTILLRKMSRLLNYDYAHSRKY